MQRVLRLVTKSITHKENGTQVKFMTCLLRIFHYGAGRAGFGVEAALVDHTSDTEPVSRLY